VKTTLFWKDLDNMEKVGLTKGSEYPAHPDYPTIGLISFGVFTFVLTAAFNGLAGSGAGVPSVFYSTVGNISDIYELYITPAGFTFSIWSIIYLWLAASLLFFVVSIFISNPAGRAYLSPPIATPEVMGTLSFNMVLNLAWIFIWDRSSVDGYDGLVILAFFILVSIAISNIAVMALMARNITKYTAEFARGTPLFWWGIAYRVVLNGLGIYTTWTVIASLINFTTALVYPGGLDMEASCIASLSLLVIFHVTWFVLENFVFDRYVRYILTPYLVVIWALNGIRSKKITDPLVPESIKNYVLAILIIAGCTFVLRLIVIIWRMFRKPLTKLNTVTSFNSSM